MAAEAGLIRLDNDAKTYLVELSGRLAVTQIEDERLLLAANALSEAEGMLGSVATDEAASRALEALLDAAPSDAQLSLASVALSEALFLNLAFSSLGSHLLEHILRNLAEIRNTYAIASKEGEDARKLLLRAADAVSKDLYELISDPRGSHIARQVVAAAVGHQHGNDKERVRNGSSPSTSGLEAKVGTRLRSNAPPPAKFPELLVPISAALLDLDQAGKMSQEFVSNPYAGPFLQQLLLAQAGNRVFVKTAVYRLLGCEKRLKFADLAVEDFGRLARDKSGSHMLEAILRVLDDETSSHLHKRFFEGKLLELARHPTANFVVQALLASLTREQKVLWAIKELSPSLGLLIASRRSGVVAALLAAALRVVTGQQQILLLKQLHEAVTLLDPQRGQGPAEILATLDLGASLSSLKIGARLSQLGCLMLALAFRMHKGAAKDFWTSLSELPPNHVAIIAADSSGSRVIEAVLEKKGWRQTLLKKLEGSYGLIAATPAGSFLVENSFASATTVEQKELIACDLAAASSALKFAPRGDLLLSRCAIDLYKRSPEVWREQAHVRAQAKQEFETLLGDKSSSGRSGARKRSRAEEASANGGRTADEANASVTSEEEDPRATEDAGSPSQKPDSAARRKMEKKRSRGKAAAAAADGEIAVVKKPRGSELRRLLDKKREWEQKHGQNTSENPATDGKRRRKKKSLAAADASTHPREAPKKRKVVLEAAGASLLEVFEDKGTVSKRDRKRARRAAAKLMS